MSREYARSAARSRGAHPFAAPLAIGTMVAAGTLGACTGSLNQSDSLLDSGSLPDLEGRLPGEPVNDTERSLASGEAGLDRSGWSETTVIVAERQTENNPTYTSPLYLSHATAREDGTYPTVSTVLQETGDGGALALEGVAAPFKSAWDLVVSPVGMVLTPPWSVVRSPEQPFQLRPAELPNPAIRWVSPATP